MTAETVISLLASERAALRASDSRTRPSLADFDELLAVAYRANSGSRSHALEVATLADAIDGADDPDMLHGTEIPIGARIVAVADAFCAMTEARPYRAPLSREAALTELESESGKQFDSICVLALRTLVSAR